MKQQYNVSRASLATPQKTEKIVQEPVKNPKRDTALIAQILRAL